MYLKVLIASFLLLLLGALIGFLGFPMLFKQLVRKQINLKPDSETRKLWEKLPFPLTFKVYVFNVTNAADIEAGGKPQLQEVGPFVFEEWKDKYDIEDVEGEDAVSFNMRNTFQLRPDLGLSGEELITMPHPLLQFMSITVQRYQADSLPAIAHGLDVIFQPQSAFVTAPFMELFYRGINVNCAQEDPAAQAICQNFQAGAVPGAVAQNATHFKFSLMSAGNHSNAGRFKVSRSRSIGKVLLYNEQQRLKVWSDSGSCNALRGTDGTIFAPYMRPQLGLWSFSPQLCRSLSPKLIGQTKYLQLPAYRYELDFGDVSLDPDQHCFCNAYPTDCPAPGTFDLTRCNGSPLVASLPHFYKAARELTAQVDGLTPTAEKHSTVLIFERLSGTVLSAHNRLQFSLSVEPVSAVPTMSKLRRLLMPLFWVEESIELDETITKMLQKKLFAPLHYNNIFRWLAIVVGCLGCGMGALLLFMRRSDAKRVGVDQKAEQGDAEQIENQ